MVKIRLKRLGRKKRAFFRIVVMDSHNRRQGAPLAELGFYNPLSRELKMDKQAAQQWIQRGAEPSDVVVRLLKSAPESGELIVLERVQKERLSKKAQERLKADADAKAAAEAAAAEAKVAEAEAKATTEAAPAQEEAPAEPAAETAEATEAPVEG